MKFISLLLCLMLACVSLHTPATEFFVGADVEPLNLWFESKYAICPYSCQGTSDGHSMGSGIRVGLWLPHDGNSKTGWEIGYDKTGSIAGSKEYYINPCVLIFCTGAIATWKHEATIKHIDVLGTVPLLHSSNKDEAMFGKIGIFSSSIKSEGNFGLGGSSYSRVVSGTGLLLGAGYLYPFTNHLSARVATDLFLYVKVADPIRLGGTLSDILLKLSLGVDYTF